MVSLGAPARILLVEDSPTQAVFTRSALVAAGHAVEVARNGRAGLASAQSGGFDLVITDATILFRSIARAYGSRSLSVILTGMGADGVDGLADVHAAGGKVIAQSERTSIVWGMPGAAVARGVVDEVLDLDAVAGAISAAVGPHS